MIINILVKFVKLLRSHESVRGVAWGLALGGALGMVAPFSAYHVLFGAVILLLPVQLAAAMLGFAVMSLLTAALDPVLHRLGFFLLTGIPALEPFWTSLYNQPFAVFIPFNNTVFLGGLILSWIFLVPSFVLMKWLVGFFRSRSDIIAKWRVSKSLKATAIVRWIVRILSMGRPE